MYVMKRYLVTRCHAYFNVTLIQTFVTMATRSEGVIPSRAMIVTQPYTTEYATIFAVLEYISNSSLVELTSGEIAVELRFGRVVFKFEEDVALGNRRRSC